MDDRSQQSAVDLTFSELPFAEDDCINSSHKFNILPASSEISASVIDNPLESSIEMGVDIVMSSSQNTTFGSELMSRHLEDTKSHPQAIEPHPHGFHWSEGSSAFFKPIVSGVQSGVETSETDEEKTHHLMIKPAPSILLNDAEMRLSPLSPPYSRVGPTHNPLCPGTEWKKIGGLVAKCRPPVTFVHKN